MEQIYSHDSVRFHGAEHLDDQGVAKTWFECYTNARALRERGAITTRSVVEGMHTAWQAHPDRPIQIASIASGSARCVIEALTRAPTGAKAQARTIDHDQEALRYSEQLARERGVGQFVLLELGNVLKIRTRLGQDSQDVVEAVGIMDYLDERAAVSLLTQIHASLRPGARVVASNIMPNPEQAFLHSAVGWRPMQYRQESQFAALLLDAGFAPHHCRLTRIPLGIYTTAEATKD